MRDAIRRILPSGVLEWYRKRKKAGVRKNLESQKKRGQVITQAELLKQLNDIGIISGDNLMVHTAMSKIGFLEDGPKTFVDALLETVGPNGNILMPSSPVDKLQYDHIRENNSFDVLHTPSKMGAITEYFRKLEGVERSTHPTEPVCALGPRSEFFTKGHFNQLTPYNHNSPWSKIMEEGGKILYVGVTLINSGTNLHVLEDAVDFKYPVYTDDVFEVEVTNHLGVNQKVKTKVHNPEFSKRRRCDELIPLFEAENVLQKVQIGQAQCLLLDAKGMLDTMKKAYLEKGITMYTPNGETIEGYE